MGRTMGPRRLTTSILAIDGKANTACTQAQLHFPDLQQPESASFEGVSDSAAVEEMSFSIDSELATDSWHGGMAVKSLLAPDEDWAAPSISIPAWAEAIE